jgi:hypothetical protein
MNIKEWLLIHGNKYVIEIKEVSFNIKFRDIKTGEVVEPTEENSEKLDIDKLEIDYIDLALFIVQSQKCNLN